MEKAFFPAFWFLSVFGCDDNPETINESFEVEYEKDLIKIRAKETNFKFHTGPLEERKLSSFEQPNRGAGRFNLIHGHGEFCKPANMTSIFHQLNDKDFDGATFQLFSTFNCMADFEDVEGDANRISNYIFDESESAEASIATAPSTLARYYFHKHEDGSIGQMKTPINLISETPLELEDGAVVMDEEEMHLLKKTNFKWTNPDNYRIGVQKRCQVILRKNVKMMEISSDSEQEVNLVFCGALGFSWVPRDRFTILIDKCILDAEYRATILAACENALQFPEKRGSNKLVLTLLGYDDEWRTPLPLITEAIKSCKDIIEKSGLEIYLLCRDDKIFEDVNEKLGDLVRETGGTIIETVKVKDEVELETGQCCCCSHCSLIFEIILFLIGLFIAWKQAKILAM